MLFGRLWPAHKHLRMLKPKVLGVCEPCRGYLLELLLTKLRYATVTMTVEQGVCTGIHGTISLHLTSISFLVLFSPLNWIPRFWQLTLAIDAVPGICCDNCASCDVHVKACAHLWCVSMAQMVMALMLSWWSVRGCRWWA